MTWDYLAGFTDGDGCFSQDRRKDRTRSTLRIRWHQKAANSEVLDAIAEFLRAEGVGVSAQNFSVISRGHVYPQRELAVYGKNAARVIEALMPVLVLKRAQALAILTTYKAVAR